MKIDSIWVFDKESPWPDVPIPVENIAIDCYDNNNCIYVSRFQGSAITINRVTTDGGKTWFTSLIDTGKIEIPNTRPIERIPRPYDVAYPDSNLCVIIGDSGYFWVSYNKCQTWERKKLETDYRYFNKVFNYNSVIGTIISYKELYVTNDGWRSWEQIAIQFPDSMGVPTFEDVWIPEPNIIYILMFVKDLGVEYFARSEDFGKTWQYYRPGIYRTNKLFFLDSLVGWAAGGSIVENGQYGTRENQYIIHTTDGGRTWTDQIKQFKEPYYRLIQIDFNNENKGVALGYYHQVFLTKDGGKTWGQQVIHIIREMIKGILIDVKMLPNGNIMGIVWGEPYAYIFAPVTTDVSEDNFYRQASNSVSVLQLYPNPASERLTIQWQVQGVATPCSTVRVQGVTTPCSTGEIGIYDVFGERVLKEITFNLPFVMGEIEVDVSGLAAGVYYAVVKAGGERIVRQFAVVR